MCEVLIPQALPCNPPHGICINVNMSTTDIMCHCRDPTFISQGDFRFVEGLNCDVYLPAFYALWGISLGIGILGVTVTLYYLHFAWERMMSRRKQAASDSKSKSTSRPHKCDTRPTILISIAISCMFYCIEAALHLADPRKNTVGTDPGTSWSFFIATTFMWLFGWQFFDLFLDISIRNSRLFGRSVNKVTANRAQRVLPFMGVWLTSGVFVVGVAPLYAPSSSQSDYILRAGYYCVAVALVFVTVLIHVAFDPLVNDLGVASKNRLSKQGSKASVLEIKSGDNNKISTPRAISRPGSKKFSKEDLVLAAQDQDHFTVFYQKLMGRIRLAKRFMSVVSLSVSVSQFLMASWTPYRRQLVWEHPLEVISIQVVLISCTFVTATTRTRFRKEDSRESNSKDGQEGMRGSSKGGLEGSKVVEDDRGPSKTNSREFGDRRESKEGVGDIVRPKADSKEEMAMVAAITGDE